MHPNSTTKIYNVAAKTLLEVLPSQSLFCLQTPKSSSHPLKGIEMVVIVFSHLHSS